MSNTPERKQTAQEAAYSEEKKLLNELHYPRCEFCSEKTPATFGESRMPLCLKCFVWYDEDAPIQAERLRTLR